MRVRSRFVQFADARKNGRDVDVAGAWLGLTSRAKRGQPRSAEITLAAEIARRRGSRARRADCRFSQ
jgi:hypothetical protein